MNQMTKETDERIHMNAKKVASSYITGIGTRYRGLA